MKFKKYIKEVTTGQSVANYDKKIGDKGTSTTDSTEIVIKDDQDVDELVNFIKQLADKHDLDVMRPRKSLEAGDVIKLEGNTEDIEVLEQRLREMGVK